MWKSYISSLKGDKPQHDVCQDYCLYKECGGVECLTLCDGVSRGEYSEIGAEFIADYVTRYFLENFDILWESTYSELNTKLVELHQSAIVDLSEHVVKKGFPPIHQGNLFVKSELYKYSTTIQLLCIKNEKVLFYKVGNGSAVIIDDSQLVLLSGSTHGDTDQFTFASTLDTIMSSIFQKIEITNKVNGFMLFSDGFDYADGFYYNGVITDNLTTFLNGLLAKQNDAQVNQYCVDYCNKIAQLPSNQANDDMSLALLLRPAFSGRIKSSSSTKVDLSLPFLLYPKTESDDIIIPKEEAMEEKTPEEKTPNEEKYPETSRSFQYLESQTNDISNSLSILKSESKDTKAFIEESIVQQNEIDKKRFGLLMLLGAFSVALSIATILIFIIGKFGNG